MEFILPAHEVNVKYFFKLAQADACANIRMAGHSMELVPATKVQ